MGTDDADGGELSALKDLIQSEGWRVLRSQADAQWGPVGYGERMRATLSAVANGPDRAYEIAQAAERVEATAQAVNELIAWPTSRIAVLTQKTQSRQPFAGLRRQRS